MNYNIRNLVEDIAASFLDNSLAHRYDICTCKMCRTDMLGFILSRVPPKYVSMESPSLPELIKQTKLELHNSLISAINEAIAVVAKNPRHQISDDKKKSLDLLISRIYQERGLDLKHYRQELLKRRLALRINANKLNSYTEYIDLLIKKPDEYDRLFEILCINISEFFRDPEVWVTAKYLFESVIRRKTENNNNQIKIWSAGSANGEEPYSIAITLKEILKEDTGKFVINIYGTDIDKKCLTESLLGRYSKDRVKNISSSNLEKYFTVTDGQLFKLKPEILNMVKFQYFELSSENYIKDVDVIFCRNVFIYFYRDMQERILQNFHNALRPQGYLIMGKVETILTSAKSSIFKEIDSEAHIYQKV